MRHTRLAALLLLAVLVPPRADAQPRTPIYTAGSLNANQQLAVMS